ncbi:MAG: integrase/recombinase XerC [Natronomonas sp.]|jgi:integrase/recombinase XerC
MGVDERAAEPAPDDPVAYFLQDMTFHGRSERTRAAYERVLRDFESFVVGQRGTSLPDATQRECMAWVHSLRGDLASSTVASYASYVHRFYAYMTQVGTFESNPMALVTEEMDESIDTDPARREISVEEMQSFVATLSHPLERALVGTLLKTGMRVGECCNLDLRDVYLDDTDVQEAYPVGPRPALDGRPDSIYVPSEPARGEVYNGEARTASNKRKRDTVIPVDEELKRLLKAWLAIRPDTDSPALFCSTSEWGTRKTPSMVRSTVAERAGERGWYRKGGNAEENVTPHYFRHFFTTHLRDRTGDRGIVKYLRGDVATDIIDTYTHNWGDRVRDVYETNIYSLL